MMTTARIAGEWPDDAANVSLSLGSMPWSRRVVQPFRHFVELAWFGALVVAGSLAMASAASSSPDSADAPWHLASKRSYCTINSLYVFAALRGHRLDYHLLEKQVDRSADGMSIIDLKELASTFGINVQVCRSSLAAVRSSSLPAIVHTLRLRGNALDQVGHFVVLLDVGDSRVTYIDGTSGELIHARREWFEDVFTGYLLVDSALLRGPFLADMELLTPCALTLLLMTVVVAFRHDRWARRSPKQRSLPARPF
jgi:hypothetical protein